MESTTSPTPGGSVPWCWIIYRPGDPAFEPVGGEQWTRPWASPTEIAQERMAEYAYWPLKRGAQDELAGLVCRAHPKDNPDWRGEARGRDWIRRHRAPRAA